MMNDPFSDSAVETDLQKKIQETKTRISDLKFELGKAKEESDDPKESAKIHRDLVEVERELDSLEAQVSYRTSKEEQAEQTAKDKIEREKQAQINQAWKSLLSVAAEFDIVMQDFKETTADLIEAVKAVADLDLSARTQMGLAKASIKTVILWHSPESAFDSRLAGKDLSVMQFLKDRGVEHGN